MNHKSSKFSLYAILALVIGTIIVAILLAYQSDRPIIAEADQISAGSIPFKVGDNVIKLPRNLDLAGEIIGLNGSLISLDEAEKRGIIEGAFSLEGKKLDKTYLLSADSSFIIKVKDIGSSPALFY